MLMVVKKTGENVKSATEIVSQTRDNVRQLKPKVKQAKKSRPSRGGPVVRLGEVATPERMKQNGGIVKELEPESAKSRVMIMRHRARCECWLDRYLLKRKIDKSEFNAGMRFREAWLFTTIGFGREWKMEFIDCAGGSPEKIMQKAGFSERTIREAFKVLSTAQKLAVISCCGQDEALRDKDRIQTLRRGLEALSRFWKL